MTAPVNESSWRILHVDNDIDDHILVRSLLSEAQGQRVALEWARSLDDARHLLEGSAYDAILVDYDLGDGTGLDLIREFVGRGCRAPMILLTGHGSFDIEVEAMRAGATLYLTKNEINALLLERSIRYAIERHQTERELRQSEERFVKAFRANAAGLTITSASDGRYLDVNDAFCELSGYAYHELIGRTSVEMGFIADSATRQKILEVMRAEGRLRSHEMQMRVRTGEFCHVLFSLEPIQIDGEDCLLGTTIDITRRKEAERDLDETHARLNSLVEADVIGVILAERDGAILEANDYCLNMLGYSRADLEAGRMDWKRMTPPEYLALDMRAIAELEARGVCQPYEKELIAHSGERVWVSLNDMLLPSGEIMALVENITARKQTEQQLRILAGVVEHSNDFIGLSTPDMIPFFVNKYGREMVGLSADFDVSQTSVMDYFWPADRPLIEELAVPALQSAGQWSGEVRFRNFTTGQPVYTQWNAFVIKDDDGQIIAIATVSPNLTRAKEVELALRDSEQRHRVLAEALELERATLAAAIENLPVGVGITDAEGNTLSMNAAGLRLHGFESREDMISRLQRYMDEFELRYPDGSLVPFDRWPASRAMHGDYLRDEEIHLVNKVAGTAHVVSYSAAPVFSSDGELLLLVYVMQDMTGRLQEQEALQASELRFRQLADSMPQLVWIARPDGEVEYYNYRHREYAGIQPEDGQGDTWQWAPALHPEDVESTVRAWTHSVRSGEPYQVEHRVQMTGGEYRWHLSRGVPAYDTHGSLIRWYGTATDIHDLKEATDRQAEYAEMLRRSNAELESFALVASHDLQEPLRKIQLFGERLRAQLEGKLSEQEDDYLKRMQNAAERMQDMIDGLLKLSRVGRSETQLRSVDMNRMASEVVSDLEARIRATGGQVIVTSLPGVRGDPLQMRQLLQNLIGNALKFHRHGIPPVVFVTGELDRRQPEPMVRIRVSDNGIGFDDSDQDRIFHPFVRLHGRSQYEGSGIGLAICRKIAERHGGSIRAHSRPGEGTVFTIELPGSETVGS